MVGRRPNHPESAMIALIKRLGYREGKVIKTYIKWNRRSLKRAKLGTGDFYSNCIWGPFRGGGPVEMDLAFPNITKSGGIDFEIDGANFHRDEKKDTKRDLVLKANGWSVVRITDTQVYQTFMPILTVLMKGRGVSVG